MTRRALGQAAISLWLVAATASSAQDMRDVEIETVPVAPGVYMLSGRGGNIGLSTGSDGAFLIDDQYAPLTDRIRAAVSKLGAAPIRFVVNTHWHADHTGGNENLGRAGALIVAHDNVRERLSVEQFMEAFGRRVPASPPAALPVVTFSDAVTFHWNGDAIRAFHVDPAHTDGDTVVHFPAADVVHMGDTYFNGFYPFIDVSSGGSVDGMVAAADLVLALAGDETKIIPGHGPLSNRAELSAYRAMLATVRDRVREAVARGETADQVVAARPTRDFDAEWGDGFLEPEPFVRIVYDSLRRR